VVEADESDGTLVEFHPEHAIVLNVDEEHLDYYANLDAICRAFQTFASQTRGRLVFCADDPRLAKLFMQRRGAISYGVHPLAGYRIAGVKTAAQVATPNSALTHGSTFEVWRGGERLGEFAIQLLGEKNVSNATAAIALLHQIGYAPHAIAGALAPFRGAARRLQELFRDERFLVFDDYGHHPSEISATLRALKALGRRRLLVAFQPHRFTRTQLLWKQFTTCFGDADRLWLTDVYPAHEDEISGVNGKTLAESISAQGKAAEYVPSLEALGSAVRAAMEPGDLVLFVGAGDITRAAHKLSAQLQKEPAGCAERLDAELGAKLAPDSVLRRNESLARRTTLRVGGRADFYVEPASEADLAEVLHFCAKEKLPFVMLGRGSNLLIRDGGIRGMVICLAHRHFSRIEILGDRLHCGAGAKLKTAAVEAKRNGLSGLEFLEGIPGSVGGALRMNAGAMGSWMFEVVESIRLMDFEGAVHERPASEVNVEYRGCPLFKNHIALGAVIKGHRAAREAIEQKMIGFSHKRWESQPAAPSAGCIFKNPPTIPAGKLIDELGLKGTRVGGAVVSDVHGNFIVNDSNATADDVLRLIGLIQQRAKEARGIDLQTEVEIIGDV
jgi:UDP-N-acetylmuramate--alanine ligase